MATSTSSVSTDTTKDSKSAKILHGILSKPSKVVPVSDASSENTDRKRGLRRKLERNVNSVYATRSDTKQESVTKKFKKTKRDKSFSSQTSKNTPSRSTSASTRRLSSERKNSDRQHWLGTRSTENSKTGKMPPLSTENKQEKSNDDEKFYYYFETQSSHIIEEKGTKLYGCEVCKGVYRYAFSLKRHFLRNHINVKYLSEADISNCMINVAQQDLIAKRHASGKRLKSNCAAAGSPRVSMQANFVSKSVSQSELYRCSLCSELFDYKEDLVEHTHNHMTAPPTVAPMAPVKAQLACEICGMKFTYKQNLIRHQAVHSGNLPFQCEYCQRSFPTLISKKQHVRIHVHNKNKNKSVNTSNNNNNNSSSSSKNKTSKNNSTPVPTSSATTTTIAVTNVDTTTPTSTATVTTAAAAAATTTTTSASTPTPCSSSTTTTTTTAATMTSTKAASSNHAKATSSDCSNNSSSTNDDNNNNNSSSSNVATTTTTTINRSSKNNNNNSSSNSGGSSSSSSSSNNNSSSSGHSVKSSSVQSTSRTTVKAEPETVDDLQCQICGKVFSCSSFLMKHIVCMHNGAMKRKANQNRRAANNQKESTSQNVKQEPRTESQVNASKENPTVRPSKQTSKKKCKFKYICTVCKRKFRSYVQMCKHRRSAHSKVDVSDKNSGYYDIEQTDFENELLPGDFDAPYLEPKDVAENVARNLCCYIDGRVDSFSDFSKYVKVKGYTSLLEHDPEYLKHESDAIWSEYNFPSSFKTENEICICTKSEELPSPKHLNSQECSPKTSVENPNESTCRLDSPSLNDPPADSKLTDYSSLCDQQTLTLATPTTSVPVTNVIKNHFLSHCGLDLVNNTPTLHPANEGTANTENICDNSIHPPLSSASVPCLDPSCKPAVCSGFLATGDASQNPVPVITTSVPTLSPPTFSHSSAQPEPEPSLSKEEDTEKQTVLSGVLSGEGSSNNYAGAPETQELVSDSVPKQVQFQSASVVHKYPTCPKTLCHTASSKQDVTNPDSLKTCGGSSNEIYTTVLPKNEGPCLQSISKNDDKKPNGLQQQSCTHNCSQSSTLVKNSEAGKVSTATPAFDSESTKVNRVLKCGQKDVLFTGPHMMTAHIHERGHLVLEFGNENEISSKIKNSSTVRHEEPQKAFSLKSSSSVKKSKKNQNLLDFSIQHIVKSRVEDYKKYMLENQMWPIEVGSASQVENSENKDSNFVNYPQYDIPTRLEKIINKNYSDSKKVSTFIKSGLLPCENLKDLENCFRGVCFQSWNCEVLNYDKIAFGKQGIVNLICSVCHKHFLDLDSLLRHQLHRHPSIECNFLEVELGQSIVALHYPTPNVDGVLCSPNIDLSASKNLETYKCSKCHNLFPTVSRLHSHIIRCASNLDNMLTACNSKMGKRKYKKRLKKRLRDVLNGSNTFKFRLKDFAGYDPTMFRENHTTQRRLADCENSKVTYIDDDSDKNRKRRGPDLSYDPKNHVRRRESVEVIETHQCRGCNIKFKSLPSLERHAPNCSHKDKLQNLKVLEGVAPSPPVKSKPQHRCHYCSKQFTYPKSLCNHYVNLCSARNQREKSGTLSAEDLQKEAAIARLVQQEEKDKLSEVQIPAENKPGETEQSSNCKGVKRKLCKKNYSWTSIKKKKNENSEKAGSDVENEEEEDGAEEEEEEEEEELDEGEDALEYDNDDASEEKEDWLAFKGGVKEETKSPLHNDDEVPEGKVCRTKAKSSDACLEELLVDKKPLLQSKTIEGTSQNALVKQLQNSNAAEKACNVTNAEAKSSTDDVACKTETSCERQGAYKNILESELYKQLTKQTTFVGAAVSSNASVKQEPRDVELTKASVNDAQPSAFEENRLNEESSKSEARLDGGTNSQASTVVNIEIERPGVVQEIQTSTICDQEEAKPDSLVVQLPVETANESSEDGQGVKSLENDTGDTDNQHPSLPEESPEEAEKEFGDESSRATQCHVSDSFPKDTTAEAPQITSECPLTDEAGTPSASYVLMSNEFLSGQSTDKNNGETVSLSGSTNVISAERNTSIVSVETEGAKEAADVPLLQLCTDGSTVVLWPVGMGGLPSGFKPVVDKTLDVTIPGLQLNLTNSSESVSSTSVCEKTATNNSVPPGIEPLPKEIESPERTSNESNLSLIVDDGAKTQDSCTERPSETIKYLLTHSAGQDSEGCHSPSVRDKSVTDQAGSSTIEIVKEPAEKHIMRSILNKPPLAAPTAVWDMLRNSTSAGPVINTSLIPIPSESSEGSVSTPQECNPILNQSSTNVKVSCGSESISLKTSQLTSDTTTDYQLKESSSHSDSETPLLKATLVPELATDCFATVNSPPKELDSVTSFTDSTSELNFSKEIQCTGGDVKHDEAISCPTADPCSVSNTLVSTADDRPSSVSSDCQEPVSVTPESLANVSQHETETDGPTCEATSLSADVTGSETGTLTGTLTATDSNLNTPTNNTPSTEECIVEKSRVLEEITDNSDAMRIEESLSGTEISMLNEPVAAVSENQVQKDGPHVTYTDSITEEPATQETVSEHSQMDVCSLNVVYTPLPEFCEVNVTLVPAVSYDTGEDKPSIVSVVDDVPLNETVTTTVSVMGDESKSEMVEAVSVPVVSNESEVEALEVADGQSGNGMVDSVDSELDQTVETSSAVDSEPESETLDTAGVKDSIMSDNEMVEAASAGDDEPEDEAVVTASVIDLKAECEREEVSVEVSCPVSELVSPVDAEIENVPVNETVEIVSVEDNLYEDETTETVLTTDREFEDETTAQAVLVDLSENETAVDAESAANIVCDSGMVTNMSTTMHNIAVGGQIMVPGLSILRDTLENQVAVVEVAVGHEDGGETVVSASVKSPEPVIEMKLVTPELSSTWENAVQMTTSALNSSVSATGNSSGNESGVNMLATSDTLRNEMAVIKCEADEASKTETSSGMTSVRDGGHVAFEDGKSELDRAVVCLRDEVNNQGPTGYVVMEENTPRASCSVFGSNFVPVVTEADTISDIVVTLSDVSYGGSPQTKIATLPETCVTLPNPNQKLSLLNNAAAPQIKAVVTETMGSAPGHVENTSVRDTHLHQNETPVFVMTEGAASTSSLIPGCSAPNDETTALHVVSSGDIHGAGEFSAAEAVIRDIPGKESTSVSVIYGASLEKNSAPVVFSSCSGKVTPAASTVYSTVLLNDAATSLPVMRGSVCEKMIPAVPLVCDIAPEKEPAVVPMMYSSPCEMEPANISVIDGDMPGEQMAAVPGGCGNTPVEVRATSSASRTYGSTPGEKTDGHLVETVSCLPGNLLLVPQPSVSSGNVSGTATVATLTCSGALPKKTGPLLQTCSTIASDKSASLTCNRVVQSIVPVMPSAVSSGVLGAAHIPLTCNDVVETSTCSTSVVSEVMDSSCLTCGTAESEKRPTPKTLRSDRVASACLTCCSKVPEEAALIPLTCSNVVLEDTVLASQACGNTIPGETAATLLTCSDLVSKEVAPAPQTCSSAIPEEPESTPLKCSNLPPERTAPTLLTGSNIVQEETAPAPLTCSTAVQEDTAPTLLACSDLVSETASTPQTCGTVVPEETVPITGTRSGEAAPLESKPLHLTCGGNVREIDILALSVTNSFVPGTESPAPLVEESTSAKTDPKSESLVSPKVSIPIGNPHTEGLMSVLSKCYNSSTVTNKSNQHLDEVTARSENASFFNAEVCNKSLTKCRTFPENNFRLKNASKNSNFDFLTLSTDTNSGSAECGKYEVSVPQNIQKDPGNKTGKQQLGDLTYSSTKHVADRESAKSFGENVRILMEEQEQDSDSDPLVVLSRVAVAKISESAMKSEDNLKEESVYTGMTTLNFESELELEVVPEAIMEGDILYDDFPSSVPFHTVIGPDSNATLETPPDCRKMMQYLSDTSRTLKHSLPPLSPPAPLVDHPRRYNSETPAAHYLSFDSIDNSTQAKHIKVTGPSLKPSPK